MLQGRDENGKRSLRSSRASLLFGSSEEKLFRNVDNEKQLQKMIDEKMSTKEILNTWAVKQHAGENGFDFDTGFLMEYDGYHSKP